MVMDVNGRKTETEVLVYAAQEQALRTNCVMYNIDIIDSDKCRISSVKVKVGKRYDIVNDYQKLVQ